MTTLNSLTEKSMVGIICVKMNYVWFTEFLSVVYACARLVDVVSWQLAQDLSRDTIVKASIHHLHHKNSRHLDDPLPSHF